MSKPVPPAELCDEIISYLWNDFQSLKACSLANKVMIVPCQKRFFHRVALYAATRRERICFNYTAGTSANFSKLLTKSPHIAGYVRSLFIYDHMTFVSLPCESIDPLDAPMVDFTESEEDYRQRYWLHRDKYLPDLAPLLCNLRALVISYTGKWRHLSFRVFNGLVYMMKHPSLLYVQLDYMYPDCIFDLGMGENIKHLSLGHGYYDEPLPVHRLSHPTSGPLRIESLFTTSSWSLNSLLQATPTRRIDTHFLRKVVVQTTEGSVTQAFLGSCDALEELKIIVDRDSSCTLDQKVKSLLICVLIILVPAPVISLDKLTTMTRFTASLGFACERSDGTLKTNMPYLRQELMSGSTSGNSALREITIGVACYYGKDYYSISEWKEIFGTLDRYSNLEVLNITIGMHQASGEGACKRLFDLLDTCDDVRRLRTLKNVDVRGE